MVPVLTSIESAQMAQPWSRVRKKSANLSLKLRINQVRKVSTNGVDRIVRDNGKKDCAGATMQIGHVATNYIRFHPSGNMFLMCEKEDINTCIGPLVRVKGGDA